MNDWFSDYEKIVAQRERKLGEQRGERRGEKRAQKNFAVNLLNKGIMTLDNIAELTGLTLGEVMKLSRTLKA